VEGCLLASSSKDPNVSDFGYPRGTANANTTALVAAYYGRLLSWLVKGSFVDEYGHTITGGPAYGNLSHWEVFNEPEGCHGLDPQGYVKQYDAVVTQIQEALGPSHDIKFVGLALQDRSLEWISYFLNISNHASPKIPLDVASFHFYANSPSRTNPDDYEGFFPQADGFLGQAQAIADVRASLSPHTKLSCDETGVILPNDNTPGAPTPPPIYWNAAGSMYAYLFAKLAAIGVEVVWEGRKRSVDFVHSSRSIFE